MKIEIDPNGIWYHGSNSVFSELRKGSTITQWRALAEAFSHKPTMLGYDDNGVVFHNGAEKGYLYAIDEDIEIGTDIFQHPRTTMDENAEFLTERALAVRLIEELPVLAGEQIFKLASGSAIGRSLPHGNDTALLTGEQIP